MGGVHIEMAVLKVLGDWLQGSGWTYVVSSVFTKDRADGILLVLCIFLCAQHIMIIKKINSEDECLTFENWTSMMEEEPPQFSYW